MPLAKSSPAPSKAPKPAHSWSFEAIGTAWWIGIFQPLTAQQLTDVQQAIVARIELFDRTYSRFRADSLVTRIAQAAGTYDFPSDSAALFALYRKLYDATDGLVTPLIGQVLSDAGYDASYSLKPGTLTTPPSWDDAMSFKNGTLVTKAPVLLDFGAAGKGYLVDLLSELLMQQGVTQFCVDGSGDMRASKLPEPLRIGLEHPADPSLVIGVAKLGDGALCGSAGNRRAWGKYHHIINPQSLKPVHNVQAVWVSAKNVLLADGLATALFFTPAAKLQKHFRFAHCVVYEDNTVQRSADFPAELFS